MLTTLLRLPGAEENTDASFEVLEEQDVQEGRHIEVTWKKEPEKVSDEDLKNHIIFRKTEISSALIREGVLIDTLMTQFRADADAVIKQYEIEHLLYTEEEVREALREDRMLQGAWKMMLEGEQSGGRQPMIPPLTGLTRQALVQRLNAYKVDGQRWDTFTNDPDNDELWLPHKEQPTITIVEGTLDVAQDPEILKTNFNSVKAAAWVENLQAREFSPVEIQIWLHLCMAKLAKGERLAPNTYDVVNATVFNKEQEPRSAALLAVADWYDEGVDLSRSNPVNSGDGLRVRASVGAK